MISIAINWLNINFHKLRNARNELGYWKKWNKNEEKLWVFFLENIDDIIKFDWRLKFDRRWQREIRTEKQFDARQQSDRDNSGLFSFSSRFKNQSVGSTHDENKLINELWITSWDFYSKYLFVAFSDICRKSHLERRKNSSQIIRKLRSLLSTSLNS